MKASEPTATPLVGVHLPLPDRQFKRFITVFHVVFVGGLVCSLIFRWRRTGLNWTWSDTSLVLLVAAQIALYLRFFVVRRVDRFALRWWGLYFVGAFGVWLVEWRLEPDFEWAIGALLGQMFGVLPPGASLPASGSIFAGYFAFKFGWSKLAALNLWEWMMGLAMITAWTSLGLFIHKLVVTSSDRARLIQELEAARRQLELARQRDAELAALRERERLARDLHDSLGHSLATLSVQLEAIERLYAVDAARTKALLEEMKQLTRTSMEQLRRSLAGLRAAGLGDRTLVQAVEQFCQEVSQRTGVKVSWQFPEQADSLPPTVAEVLWRAAHEGLANAEKHSHAQKVNLVVEMNGGETDSEDIRPGFRPKQVIVRVVDDGVGLPAGAEFTPGHYGLRGLRERVEGIGGSFNLRPGNPTGTVLEARIPVVSL